MSRIARAHAVSLSWSALVVTAVVTASGCSGTSVAGTPTVESSSARTSPAPTSSSPGAPRTPDASGRPSLGVEVVARGLTHGWDIGFLPDGKLLVTQRPGRIVVISGRHAGATVTPVRVNLDGLFVSGEGGLLGMVLHRDFATTRLFTTCQNHQVRGKPVDIRLVTYRLAKDNASAVKVKDLLTGIPTNPGGKHSGCRPTIARDGSLIVGTGDTAKGTVPQDLRVLGGKTLRLDIRTGKPVSTNPLILSTSVRTRYIYTYGHRNIQGVTIRPSTGEIYTVEHGPGIEDEINRLRPGGNYGWDPSRGGTVRTYDQTVPMTDLKRFPKAVRALFSTGVTWALSGADFASGRQWGSLDGALAVAALKGSRLTFFPVAKTGRLGTPYVLPALDQTYGRLRAVRRGPDGALYVTSSNGTNDVLLRVAPR